MSNHANSNWHNANGGGLPYRPPPTVDEALPYLPFTSIVPFSPDIIPFPSAEPPTPPSTLTTDQRNAADKAVNILNNEIKGQTTTEHLSNTLRQLRELLDCEKLPEYNFKPMAQLATPPPESAAKEANGAASQKPTLSPFASMLLRETNISFTPESASSELTTQAIRSKHPQQSRQSSTPSRPAAPHSQARASSQSTATPNKSAHAQNAQLAYPPSTPSYNSNVTPVRPGPTVIAKPLSGRRDEYTRYDNINVVQDLSQQKKRDRETDSALRPHEREIADRKLEDLQNLVSEYLEDKDNLDGSTKFMTVSTPDGDLTVLKPKATDALSEKIANIINLGRFSVLPVDLVMEIQSLLQPTITWSTKAALFSQDDDTPDWSESIESSKSALKASKMVLDTMIEGRDDYRMRREEIIDVMIDLIKFIKDSCIAPILQARRSGSSESLFSTASEYRQQLQSVLRLCGSVIGRFASLIGRCNLSDRALNTLEYLALELLMEQNSDSEKDSIFGIQKFEQFRQKAVDVLAQIFARHAEQRNSILNGILSNLEKLPDKKASARHYKSARELPIMTISALFMRFVQVSAVNRETRKPSEQRSNAEQSEEEGSDYEPGNPTSKANKKSKPSQVAVKLHMNALNIAAHIARSLVDRASNVSKTGDKPFRNLLDLFIEDFCNVLGSPEWPAADMLLQQLLGRMQHILFGDGAAKQSVVDKDMALATMARIGCGVIDFTHRLKKLKRNELDVSQSDISSKLDRLFEQAIHEEDAKERVNDTDLLAFDGPYRMVIESLRAYMDLPSNQDDPQLQSVSACHVTLWMAAFMKAFTENDADSQPLAIKQLHERLDSMIMDAKWLHRNFKFQSMSAVQSKIAAGIITLQNAVCRYVPQIVNMVLQYTRDKSSSKLRSRAMACLDQLIHQDPRVITEDHVRSMAELFLDASPMVRESTLSLVATCLEREPSLERLFLPRILGLTTDPSNGPKKKAIKLLKDIYAGSSSQQHKINISANLLKPSQDSEKSVAELTRSGLEEMWLTSSKAASRGDNSQLKLERAQRSTLLTEVIQLIQDSPDHLEAFEKFFIWAFSDDAKNPGPNLQTCKNLVADLIDDVISPGADVKSQARIMTTLSIFAKVKASLFTVDQMHLLKLYIKEIATPEDLGLLRPTVTIFRYVFATISTLQQSFAEEVRVGLVKNVSKLANWASNAVPTSRNTLVDVAHCLWTITPMTEQGPLKLCTMITSILCQLRPLVSCDSEQAAKHRNKITSYLILLGTFGKVCRFDQHITVFRDRLSIQARNAIAKKQATAQQLEAYSNSTSSASLILLDAVRPFTMQNWDMNIREQALQSVGGICQQSPELFMRGEIEKVFKLVFINQDNDNLRRVALAEFNEYFTFAERRSETGAEIAVGKGASLGNARLDSSFVANENDSATLHIAQRFLSNFVNTALNQNNDLAILATNIIASISRQGLVHPKECGAALVALGTSSNEKIALIASTEHKRIHEKQESYLEKEYMQAIKIAFEYQQKVFGDPHGMREPTYSPKLARLFEALKTGKKATFKKFVDNICRQINFDLQKLDTKGDPPEPVLFARFCLENLALLDFPHLEELAACLNSVEAIVLKNTGPAVALVIETEMPRPLVAPPIVQDGFQHQFGDASGIEIPFLDFANPTPAAPQLAQVPIDDARLRQITTACMILQMVWETRGFIRRLYNLHKNNGRISQKEYAKPAQRNNLVSGKELWERLAPIMNALDTREAMLKTCHDFAELLDVDREALVDEEGDDDGLGAGYETPTEGDDAAGIPYPTSGRGRKRKSNISLSNTPKKARSRTSGTKKKRNSRTPDDDDDSD